MTPFAETVYSDPQFDPEARAKPDPASLLAARSYHTLLTAQPPAGSWGADPHRQTDHYTGIPFIAIRAANNHLRGASFLPMKRRRKVRDKTTFGPGDSVAKSTGQTQSQGRDEEYVPLDDYDNPVASICRHPNPNESIGEWAAKVSLQNLLTGIAPVWSIGSKATPEKPIQLWALRTQFLYPIYQQTQQYPNGAWRVNPLTAPGWSGYLPGRMGTGGCVIPGEEVKRWLEPHPKVDWTGWAPMEAGAVEIDVFDSIEQSWKASMDNGLNLDTVLIAPGAQQEQVDRMKEQMEARHKGARNAGKIGVLATPIGGQDKYSFVTTSTTPDKMKFVEGRESMIQFLLALFQVSPTVAGLSEPGAYAADFAAEQRFHRMQQCRLDAFAEWFTRSFLRPWDSYPDEYLLKVTPRPVNDHERSLAEREQDLKYDLLTYNQALAKRDLPPVPGGDILRSAYVQQQIQKYAADRREPQLPSGAPDLAKQDEMNKPMPNTGAGSGDRDAKPAGGAASPPRPANKAGAGSLPPRPQVAKAMDGMSSLSGSDGGFLIPSGESVKRKKRRKRVRPEVVAVLKAALKDVGDNTLGE